MATVIKKELILQGLNCANCANKIEDKVRKIGAVKEVSMNFMTKGLTLEIEGEDQVEESILEVKNIVKALEPDVIVKEKMKAKPMTRVLGKKVTKADGEEPLCSCEGAEHTHGDAAGQCHERKEQEHSHKSGEQGSSHEEEDQEHSHGHDHDHGEAVDKKELITLAFGGALFVLATFLTLPREIEFVLYFISYLVVGGEVLLRAGKNVLRGQVFDENFLMAIATIGAFSIGQFPEGVGVMLFYQVGELFQGMAVNHSRKSITKLMDIRPDFANLKVGSETQKVAPEAINVGDFIVVKPGEKIPLDGTVTEGSSTLDTSALTGESMPREVAAGESVLGGYINQNGLLVVQVTKEFGESTVTKILELVENASGKKAPTENFITKFSRYYTPIVVFSALALAFLPPLFIADATFSAWIYRALVFLVVSCPCALVISIPLGFFGGIGGASKNGILVKGGNYLEALNNVELVVFDKTGTLTKGTFKVTEIIPEKGFTKEEVLAYAAAAESYSSHPIALSILKAYGKEIGKENLKEYEEIPGQGISVVVNGKAILVGNGKLMNNKAVSYKEIEPAGTILYIAIDKVYAGFILISDEIKEDAVRAIQGLKEMGVKKTVMLTGDHNSVAQKVGREVGVDEIYGELLPHEKVERLEALEKGKSTKGKLIFVGDGINDAPVLARADIGIAMGGIGSDAAIEAADVVIMSDEPSKIVTAIKIAKRTKIIVTQNIIFALGVKIIILVLGAMGIATMWEAVFGDVGVALIAVLNAMRAMKVEII